MTPTPEEVKDRVAKIHAYKDWDDAISSIRFNTQDNIMIDKLTSEAMQEYAEALYKDRIENGASELLTELDFTNFLDSELSIRLYDDAEKELMQKIYGWMKEQALVVISKLKYDDETHRKNVNELLKENEILYNKLEQKDKEIANKIKELKKYKNMLENHRDSIKKTTNN